MNEDEQDTYEAQCHQQDLEDARRRESELLARSPAAHRELMRIEHETAETCKALNWAIDRVFRP